MTTSLATSSPTSAAARATTGRFWQRDVYTLVVLACVLFILLTTVAMRLYPGGTIVDPGTQGYRFFENYLSDLGVTRSRSGVANLPAMLCFSVALVSVGLGMGAFFVAFTHLCAAVPRALQLSRRAALLGALTGLSFIGVAAAPRDLLYPEHIAFELLAFPAFLAAVALELAALRAPEHAAPPGLPHRVRWAFVGLAVALAAYLVLLAVGPSDTTLVGERMQVTGQKVVVYVAIAAILLQSLQAQRLASRLASRLRAPAWRKARRSLRER